ncbi:RDD family protein [Pontibacter pamirensis]|uniref:RDD family protein n=1 Tax=Pontibacter pamirensis TaxID=2562824 RepID=UPI001389AB1C|nr:RDD family protein [Pontibacter pamirensis]
MQFTYTQQDKKTELASLKTRLAAFSVDVLLILTLIGIADFLTFSSNDDAFLLKPERLLHLLLSWLYFAGTETCPCQATLGKYLLHLRVTTTTNERISFKAATIRYIAKPLTAIVLVKQFLLSTLPTTLRTVHDKLAHTQVILR